MMTRYGVALDGMEMRDIAPEIMVLDIEYDAPVREIKALQMAGRDGRRWMGSETAGTSVLVHFEVHSRNIVRRRQVLEDVQRWAMAGGHLTTQDRPGQQLLVRCETVPTVQSAHKWTNRLTIVFTSYEMPFWEDIDPIVVTLEGGAGADVFAPGFSAPARVGGAVTNTGSTAITGFTVTAGETVLKLEGIALAPGESVVFGTDERGLFSIDKGGESWLAKRTADSSDELLMEAPKTGHITLQVPSGTATGRFEIWGRYV